MAISGGDGSIILTTKIDEAGLKKGVASMRNFVGKVGKSFAVISAAAATATVAITKMAVSAYADYEQLVGGVETLFKGSAQKVIDYANDAFMTAGISANEYMQTAIGVSASLIQSLGGDTAKAADIANMAIIDMSDNVNKLGTDMERVKMAYAGFARQQYVLLDNLALGYQGTKTEMERLLRDAEAYMASQGKTVKYNINNLSDVYSAINAIQQKLGIAGTTVAEAEKTITGSANMMKAAWQNVLSAIAGGGDLDKAINNLVYSIQKYFENIVPVVQRSLVGIGRLIEQIAPMLVQNVAIALIKSLPSLVNAVYQMIIGLAKGIWQGIKSLGTQTVSEATADLTSNVGGVSASTANAVSGMEDLTDATKKAGKEAKKSLTAFDDLNIISSGAGGASAEEIPEANIGGIGGGSFGGLDLGEGQIESKISKLMASIMAIVGGSLVALGVILISFGQIPLGIGTIVAGIASLGVGTYSLMDNVTPRVRIFISGIMAIISGALIVIGIILICTGVGIAIGIGLILAGLAGAGFTVAANWGYIKSAITNTIDAILGSLILSASLVVIGLILILTGVGIPLGFGLLLLGLGSMGYQILSPHWDFIKDKVSEIWKSLVDIWNSKIKPGLNKVQKAWEELYSEHLEPIIDKLWNKVLAPFLGWLKEVFIIAMATWFDSSFSRIGAVFKLLGDMIGNFLEILTNVLDFVTNIFSGDWKAAWKNVKNIFKTSFEGIGNIAESVINMIIDSINKLIEGINKIKFNAPDWVPLIGGKQWGFNIPKIPPLAQGTVVPPNREFLAVLGDNTKEHEIVSPLSTMKQAFTEAMLEMGGNFGGGNTEVVLEIDGREFGRAVVEQGNRENRRIGTRLVIA